MRRVDYWVIDESPAKTAVIDKYKGMDLVKARKKFYAIKDFPKNNSKVPHVFTLVKEVDFMLV